MLGYIQNITEVNRTVTSKDAARQAIENDIAAFKKKGGRIQKEGVKVSTHVSCWENKGGKSAKAVVQMTTDGVDIRTFDSIAEANKALNIANSKISQCCKGSGNKVCAGYRWRFVNPADKIS